jgi:predicted Zn finger-like uncharacterized protein
MKIVCDSCGTKYSISDDKVRGKVFKIRCKKCSHIIVVRGTNETAAAAPAAAPAEAAAGGWHLVVDGDQVGPIPESEIRARVERGEINAETYVWKEGFADWLKMSAVPELSGLVTEPGMFGDGAGAVNGDAGAHEPASGGLFSEAAAGGGEEADVFGGLAPAKRGGGSAAGDLFASSTAAARPATDEPRWPAASAAPAAHDGGRIENLTGQRHENSVLFSLSNLQSLAMPAPASKSLSTTAPTSEGSGLIDIRAMAATTLGTSTRGGPSFGGGSDDLPAFSAFSPAPPVLLALPTNSGPPKWIYAVIGVAVIAVVVIAALAFKILGTSTRAGQVETAAVPAATAPVAGEAAKPSAPVAANAPAPSTIPDEQLPPREAPKAEGAKGESKAEGKGDKSEKGEHHKGKHGDKSSESSSSSRKGGGDSKAVAAATAAAAPPPEKKPAKGSLDDLLDGALNHKSSSSSSASSKPRVDDDTPRAAASAGPLSKGAVVAGMNSVKGKIGDCYQQFKVPGMAMVNVVIGKSGRVSSATVSGKFAGTPTGSCVERAVKSASFPPSDGFTTPYPFQLK